MMQFIKLPINYEPRPYQRPAWIAMTREGIKRFLDVRARRLGKDRNHFSMLATCAIMFKGAYIIAIPELKQGRSIFWQEPASDGLLFHDFISPAVVSTNSIDMRWTLFNGSTIQIKPYNKLSDLSKFRGNSLAGILISECAFGHEELYETIEPAINENNGFVFINSTPNGENHFYDQYKSVMNDPNWHVSFTAFCDAYLDDANTIRAIPDEFLINSNMSEERMRREYGCDFSVGGNNTMFLNQMDDLIEENRFSEFPINLNEPVYCSWDHGYNDATAIVFFQYIDGWITIHDSYMLSKHLMIDHINHLDGWFKENKAIKGTQFLPHDGKNTNDQTGLKRVDFVNENGYEAFSMPRVSTKKDIIEYMRANMNRLRINKRAFAVKQKLYAAVEDKTKMNLTWKHDDLLDAISYAFHAIRLGLCDVKQHHHRPRSNTSPRKKGWLER